MTYYSDEDRRRAAAKRRLNSQFEQMRKSPEDVYDIFGVSVPFVANRPLLSEYGLADDIEEWLQRVDREYVRSTKSTRKTIAAIVTAVAVWLCWLLRNQIIIFIVFGEFALWVWASEVEPKKTEKHIQLERYKTQLSYYEYWQRRKRKDYWNHMKGHQFEDAVANLFRRIGFTAQVSKRGGDGGIDIVLQKGSRRIAVQCKRYKNNVGPHTIRDLWGTMHYLEFNEGCIVTTTGFTKGVVEFAKTKNIFLIDLNDILRSTGEAGETYLKSKIGES